MANKRPRLSDSPTEENENIKETTNGSNENLPNVTRSEDKKVTEVAPCTPVKEDNAKEKRKHPKNDVNNDPTKINDNKQKMVDNTTTDNANDSATVIVGENVETVVAKVPETNEQKENPPERNQNLKSVKVSVSSEENMPKKNQDPSATSEANVSGDLKDKESSISSSESGDVNSENENADEKQNVLDENNIKQDIIKTQALDKITEDVVKISLKSDNEDNGDNDEKNISKESEKSNTSTEITDNNSKNETEGNVEEKGTSSEENETSASTSNGDIESHISDELRSENLNDLTGDSASNSSTEEKAASTIESKSESNGDDSENDNKDDYLKIKDKRSPISPLAYNPCLADGEIDEHELNRLRGDAIGDTMYSERFVLATLLNLNAVTLRNLNSEFEKNLCSLWDMTTEEDVVKLLLKYGVFELFTPIIEKSTECRLQEILIGIIGNMCYFECAREDLVNRFDTMAMILALVSNPDTPTLIQLMRLLATALDNKSPIESYKWFQHFRYASSDFVMSLAHILSNCLSNEVLSGTLHALSVITSRFSMLVTDEFEEEPDANGQSTENVVYDFSDIFVDSTLVTSVIEGFQRLASKWALSSLDDEDDGPYGQNTRRTTLNYLLIHTHICNCGSNSTDIYNEHKKQFISTTNAILRPLSVPAGLLPLKQFQYDVVDQIYEFYMALEYPSNKECLKILLIMWSIIRRRKKSQLRKRSPSNDFEEDASTNKEMSLDFMLCVLRKFISYHLIHLSHKETKEIMATNNIDNLYTFMRDLDTNAAMEERMTNVIDNYIERKTKKKAAT